MLKENFLLRIVALIFIMTLFLYAQDDKTNIDIMKISDAYTKNCNSLKLLIQNPGTWEKARFSEDAEKAENLVSYLDLAVRLKVEGLEGFFIKKIDFTPYDKMDLMLTLEKEFPVYNALCRMSLGAIGPLVEFIKQNDYKTKQVSVSLSVRCLVKIYEKGGFGKEMAKKRLELELANATESEKININKALELIDSK